MSTSSIHDVARYCGVSTATVSRALRGLPNVSPRTRQRVQAAAAELGYVVSPAASALSTGRKNTVAVVVPETGSWFYSQVIDGIARSLRTEGFDTFLVGLEMQAGRRTRTFSNSLLRKRADAVIALGVDFTGEERRELRAGAIPTGVVGSPVSGVRSVGIDDDAATVTAVDHLLSLGHRRIAHLGGEDEYGMVHSVAAARRHAWHRTLLRAGVEPEDSWFVSGGFHLPRAKDAARDLLLRADRPSAVFAASDEMAFGLLLTAAELGIAVPEQLSVIGIDDHAWSAAFGLTTVHQDPREQGADAARAVLDELGGIPVARTRVTAPSALIERTTTAAPGGGGLPLGAGRGREQGSPQIPV